MLGYRLKFQPDDNGTVLVTSPDFPLVTYGETTDDAMRNARDAVDMIVQSMLDAREPVPLGTDEPWNGLRMKLSTLASMKVELHQTMLALNLTRADLQRRLRWQRESVDRLFRLDHHSRLDQIDEAFEALGKVVLVDVRDAATLAKGRDNRDGSVIDIVAGATKLAVKAADEATLVVEEAQRRDNEEALREASFREVWSKL